MGGAIIENGNGFTVTDSEFVGNQATATDPSTAANGFVQGGAITLRGDGGAVISGSLFQGNFVETNSADEREEGGALRLSGTGTKRIVNSTFHGNRVGDAGSLQLARNEEMYAVAEVYETDVARVRTGQRATVTSPALAAPLA